MFKSFYVAMFSNLCSWFNGDIPPSLIVLFLMQYFLTDTPPLKFCNPFKFCLWLWCSSWRYKISAQRKYKNDKYANVSQTWNLRGLQSSDPKFWCFLPPYFMFSLFPNCQMIKEMLMYHYMQMRTSIFRVLYFCLQTLVVKFLKEYSNVTYFPFFMWSFTQILQIPRKCHQSLPVCWTNKINPLLFNILLLTNRPFKKCHWSSFYKSFILLLMEKSSQDKHSLA